jgi:hypothetical protein
MYYGKMGFTYTELYQLPVYLRKYFYRKLADVRKKENEAEQKAYQDAKSGSRPVIR